MNLKNLKDEYKKVKDEFISLKEKNKIFNKECKELEKIEFKTFKELECYKEKLKEAHILKNNFLENSKKMKKLEKDLIEYKKYKKIGFWEILGISFIFSFLKDLFSKNKE